MFIWAPLARKAKYARLSHVWLYFFSIQLLLFLPTAYAQVKTEPYVMYARIHGGPQLNVFNQWDDQWPKDISVGSTADGYIHFIEINGETGLTATETPADEAIEPTTYRLQFAPAWDESVMDADYGICITPEYILYRDKHALLAVPTAHIPAWVLQERDFPELFNYLALSNAYFSSVLWPVIFFMLFIFLMGQAVFYWTISWMFGQTRLMTTYMTLRERFTVCVYASIPVFPLAFLVGFIVPVVNVLLFELVVLYVAYKILGEY